MPTTLFSFSSPIALVLLLALPLVIYLGWPRQRFRRLRDSLSLALRSVLVLMLVLALAGLQIAQSANKLAVVFLVDVSDSIGVDAQAQELDYVRQALQNMGPDDVAGVVVFGADPRTERLVNAVRELGEIQSEPVTSNTDIAEAIRHGIALFPSDAARRLVILSDGRATVGDTDAALRQAAALGVEVSYVVPTVERGPEVQVTDLSAPSTVTENQPFDLSLTIESDEATAATVTILDAGTIIKRQEVDLRPGANHYTLSLPGSPPDFKYFRVQVDPQGSDGFRQNNELATFSQIVGPPRALLVSQNANEIQYLRPALEEGGVQIDVITPDAMPTGPAALIPYDAVVMANVPATALSNVSMETLDSYVRDLGGGLVFIGGPESYAPGGYFRTPLENTLPVETQIKDQQRLPQLSIVYLIDRSGSMGTVNADGVQNIDLAKEAIIRSIDFLQPTDRAGVVSFDTDGLWIAPIQPVLDRLGLQREVGRLRAGGGTDILAGMRLAAGAISQEQSDRKHIILLTDGGASPEGLIELAGTLRRDSNVTTSIIAIGEGSADFLADMAAAGGGNYHQVDLVETIPQIFTMETVLASRSYILEQDFVPSGAAPSPILSGITSVPNLLGYVATEPKQTAQVILKGPAPFEDPILASWQYGLGRAVAFTSDATARWGAHWVTWDNFTRFWSQALAWTMTQGSGDKLELQVVLEGEQARLIVDARSEDGQFLNGLNLQAAISSTTSDPMHVNLHQIAPGRYEAVFTPTEEGAYFLSISGQGVVDGNPIQVRQITGWVMSYSPEYRVQAQTSNVNLLRDLAQMTGGRDMAEDPALPFVHNLVVRNAYTPLWPYLLLAVLLLLPVDIAVRRLVITPSDLRRARLAIFGAGRNVASETGSERISSLIGARERGRHRAEETSRTLGTLRANQEQRRAERPQAATAETGAQEDDQPRYVAPRPDYHEPGATTTGELLKTIRKRRDDED